MNRLLRYLMLAASSIGLLLAASLLSASETDGNPWKTTFSPAQPTAGMPLKVTYWDTTCWGTNIPGVDGSLYKVINRAGQIDLLIPWSWPFFRNERCTPPPPPKALIFPLGSPILEGPLVVNIYIVSAFNPYPSDLSSLTPTQTFELTAAPRRAVDTLSLEAISLLLLLMLALAYVRLR